MAVKGSSSSKITRVNKRTSQGGNKPKTSSMNKASRSGNKQYRGQGR
jgi:hypothetical protein